MQTSGFSHDAAPETKIIGYVKNAHPLISAFVISISMGKNQMSRVVRKPAFCICENKDADQLRDDREADQRLCFRYIDSTIPLLPKSEISCL